MTFLVFAKSLTFSTFATFPHFATFSDFAPFCQEDVTDSWLLGHFGKSGSASDSPILWFSLHFPHFFPNGASLDFVTFCHRIQKTYTNCCILWRSGKLGILHVCIISPNLQNSALSICSNSPPSSFAPFVEISPITSPKTSHCIPQSIPLKDHLCITIRISFRILLVNP